MNCICCILDAKSFPYIVMCYAKEHIHCFFILLPSFFYIADRNTIKKFPSYSCCLHFVGRA